MILVELAPEVAASRRAMEDRGTPPPRCHSGVIRSAIAGVVRRLIDDVLAALGIAKPDGVELEVVSEDLGQIYDGAGPYSTYVRGVIVDGDRGVLLTGSGGSAVVIEG